MGLNANVLLFLKSTGGGFVCGGLFGAGGKSGKLQVSFKYAYVEPTRSNNVWVCL